MKKWTIILVSISLLLVCSCTLADAGSFCDPVPQGVLELNEQTHLEGDVTDCILIKDTPIGDLCFVLTAGDHVDLDNLLDFSSVFKADQQFVLAHHANG